MTSIKLIFPHQLYKQSSLLKNGLPIFLIEEHLFFTQYKFHKQKIAFHRASMKAYEAYLIEKNIDVHYIESTAEEHDIRKLIPFLAKKGINEIHYIDSTDFWLEKRLNKTSIDNQINLKQYPSQLFLNSKEELASFFKPNSKKYFQTKFYKEQRNKRNILIDKESKPIGGKWSFDSENRKKYPKSKIPPSINYPSLNKFYSEAIDYTNKNFSFNFGEISNQQNYPINFKESENWLKDFLNNRFAEFGPYEDAIVKEQSILNHSLLTPMLNVGMLSPAQIIEEALDYAEKNNVPINSLEGFVRQIIGWREFIRGVYQQKGVAQRTRNFWQFKRRIPSSFYDGTTGIEPIDITIKKVLKTGYCHHIERLMVLGNFMALCEFDPNEVYKWFMEMFIDAYDWVMVPNVYGMSQYADGGLMSTKPYISGSNYLMKMSNYTKGSWQKIWDSLFWRFMNVHRDFFLKNPRMGMLIRSFDKMDEAKQNELMKTANEYLSSLN